MTPTTTQSAAPTPATAARRGKIARLPAPIRRQLNFRLENNESADLILPWLNGLPETRQILATYFGGARVTPQNLSEWRQGGFREAQLLEELMCQASALAEGASELSVSPENLADHLATAVAVRYAALLAAWDGKITPEFEAQLNILRRLTQDITGLQKSLHRAAEQNHELARQKKAEADAAFSFAKQTAIRRFDLPRRRNRLHQDPRPWEHTCAMVDIEDAATPSELAAILDRSPSPLIQLDPTKSNPAPVAA